MSPSADTTDIMSTGDVAIIGGGPAGSTCGALIRKYNPDLEVAILEKEVFPREHVGESQLPGICAILNEMGAWDKIEAAGFPIKLGATYRWGSSPDLWDFGFLPTGAGEFQPEPRPARYEGQRLYTAFQVDRARFDEILLEHARELGCNVQQPCRITDVMREGDRVTGLQTDAGDTIEATHYVDCSGVGVIRRAMDVELDQPTNLRNIAMWDYWENAEWAIEHGNGGTRVLVLSIGCGWLWFIPLSETRTSIGFICPADHYKDCGRSPEELYGWAVEQEPFLQELVRNATRENDVRTTKDWSCVAQRMVGENWFLAGDAAGFADPILAGGMMLAHGAAREVAYAILELVRGEHDADWLRTRYNEVQGKRVRQHIRFADFWYAANGQFTDLEDLTASIARDAGLKLTPKNAFRWLSNGGFTNDPFGQPGLGGLSLGMLRQITGELTNKPDMGWELNNFNVFKLNLQGARREEIPILAGGRITPTPCFVRDDKTLPVMGVWQMMLGALENHSGVQEICQWLTRQFGPVPPDQADFMLRQCFQALEVMLYDGWVWGQLNPKRPRMKLARVERPQTGKVGGSVLEAKGDGARMRS